MPDLTCGCRYSKDRQRLLRACKRHPHGADGDPFWDRLAEPGLQYAQRTSAQGTNAQRTEHQRTTHWRTISSVGIVVRRKRLSPCGAIGESGSTSKTDGQPFRWDAALYADIRDEQTGEQGFHPAYRARIGPTPQVNEWALPEEKHHLAWAFLQQIEQAQEDLRGRLTQCERRNLYALEVKWARRAYGRDARYLAFGTRAGRIGDDDHERLRTAQYLVGDAA